MQVRACKAVTAICIFSSRPARVIIGIIGGTGRQITAGNLIPLFTTLPPVLWECRVNVKDTWQKAPCMNGYRRGAQRATPY